MARKTRKSAETKDKTLSSKAENRGGQRLDKWLWYARIVKSRSLAQKLVSDGKVRLNSNRVEATHKTVMIDDVLAVTLERQIKVLRVLDPGSRRGPAKEAQELYEDLSPPVERKAWQPDPRKAPAPRPEGRPDKKDRKALEQAKREGKL